MSFDEQPEKEEGGLYLWLAVVGIGSMLVCLAIVVMTVSEAIKGLEVVEESPVPGLEYENTVKCGSYSMGLVLYCGDKLSGHYVTDKEVYEPGGIYVFNETGYYAVHRLVYIINDTHMVFKGDNNFFGELVQTKNIISRITGVDYD